ncbi:hypothetical protein [Absidia glauca]|uniref:Uncharacterized protein n=1 Tax=Absidia glauca TaxID=4829 RepID=A0A163JYJ3_ABSGL|nr:hypothetical protein [Absidia glauca]
MSAAGLPLSWSQTITSPSFGALSELAVSPALSAVRVGEVDHPVYNFIYGEVDGPQLEPDRCKAIGLTLSTHTF